MLLNRKIRVFLSRKVSYHKYLQNGLPQGSVLSPLLFNTYIVDIIDTSSRKFKYADHVDLVTQAKNFTKIERIFNVMTWT